MGSQNIYTTNTTNSSQRENQKSMLQLGKKQTKTETTLTLVDVLGFLDSLKRLVRI